MHGGRKVRDNGDGEEEVKEGADDGDVHDSESMDRTVRTVKVVVQKKFSRWLHQREQR
jgi:hypothetical protein